MQILVIIKIIIDVVRYLPQIVQLVHAIIELIRTLKGNADFKPRLAMRELSLALRDARRTKDTSKLEALHAKLSSALSPDAAVVQPLSNPTAEAVADELKDLGRELEGDKRHPFAGFREV